MQVRHPTKTLIVLLFILCLVLVACDSAIEPLRPQETPHNERIDTLLACEDNKRIVLGDYILHNNVWNKGDRTDYTQCVFAQSDTPSAVMGWRWAWPGTGKQVKAYPEVMYGNSPWDDEPPTGRLPVPVSVRDLFVTYDASIQATGIWNVALEMWLTSSLSPAEENITDEVMIWIDADGMVPGSSVYDTMTLDGMDYYLVIYKGHGDNSGGSSARWSYIAFVSREPMLSGTLNIGSFLDYLLQNEIIEPDRYIASIELGTEVASGEGEFILSAFEIAP